jgi:hypothetical protein
MSARNDKAHHGTREQAEDAIATDSHITRRTIAQKESFKECPICHRRVRAHPITGRFVAHSPKKKGPKNCLGVLNTERGAIIAAADNERPIGNDIDRRTTSGGLPTLGKR